MRTKEKAKDASNGVLALAGNSKLTELRHAYANKSTKELKKELAELLGFTADNLSRLATVVMELEARGENLKQLRIGLLPLLRLIASEKLLPEIVVMFAGAPAILKQIASMSISEQKKIASGVKTYQPKLPHRGSPKRAYLSLNDDEEERANGKFNFCEASKNAGPRDVADMAFQLIDNHPDKGTVLFHLFGKLTANGLVNGSLAKEMKLFEPRRVSGVTQCP